jgi:hypothetical protein
LIVAATDLPKDVLGFLDERIESVPHLEALLILWESGSAWDASGMAGRIYLSVAATNGVLQDLRRAGLAVLRDEARYSYDGRWDERSVMMAKVAQTYQQNVTRVTMRIHRRVSAPVLEFARAFDLKKEQ